MAYRDWDASLRGAPILKLKTISSNLKEEELEKDLVLIAIMGIKDPIRKDVPRAI